MCKADADCLSDSMPLLNNVRKKLIDDDTPDSVKSKTSKDGKKLKLVVRVTRDLCQEPMLTIVVLGRVQ